MPSMAADDALTASINYSQMTKMTLRRKRIPQCLHLE